MRKILFILAISLLFPLTAFANKIYFSGSKQLEVVDLSGVKSIDKLKGEFGCPDLKDITQERLDEQAEQLLFDKENAPLKEVEKFKKDLIEKKELLVKLEELAKTDPELKKVLDDSKSDSSGLSYAALAAALAALGGTALKKKNNV